MPAVPPDSVRRDRPTPTTSLTPTRRITPAQSHTASSTVGKDVDLLGFWNSGTALSALLDLDIGRSGTNRKLAPDY